MLGRRKLLILIPAILLIPILLGMTPLSMVHKLSNGGPFTHAKQVRLSNHCLFHSLTSHHDLTVAILSSVFLDLQSLSSQELWAPALDPVPFNTLFNPVPLRC
jgi:hypothetical protein